LRVTIAQRPTVHNDALFTIDCIRDECGHQAANVEITLAKSWLTRRFGNRPGNSIGRGSREYLYKDVLPYLIQTGQARALPKVGRLEQFVFEAE
jgi:hypothetical protein